MNLHYLRHQFDLTSRALEYNIEGITDEESLSQPERGGNCVNWVVGHILESRDCMFEEFSGPAIMTDAERKKYQRGSDTIIKADENILSLTVLRERLKESGKSLSKCLIHSRMKPRS